MHPFLPCLLICEIFSFSKNLFAYKVDILLTYKLDNSNFVAHLKDFVLPPKRQLIVIPLMLSDIEIFGAFSALSTSKKQSAHFKVPELTSILQGLLEAITNKLFYS